MKYYFHILILIFAFFWNVYLFADVNHVIVYTNGLTDIGLIDSLTADSVYFHDFDIKKYRAEPLKKVYFIYNDFQKLFYKRRFFNIFGDFSIRQFQGLNFIIWGK